MTVAVRLGVESPDAKRGVRPTDTGGKVRLRFMYSPPAEMPTPEQIAWTAGYLEGDGSFDAKPSRVRASSNDLEPLERLVTLYGGTIAPSKLSRRRDGTMNYEWAIYGSLARAVTKLVSPWLSKRRLQRILAPTTGESTP